MFGVSGYELAVRGFAFTVRGFRGFAVRGWGFGFVVLRFGVGVFGVLRCGVWGLRFGVSGLSRFGFSGAGFGVRDFRDMGFRVRGGRFVVQGFWGLRGSGFLGFAQFGISG